MKDFRPPDIDRLKADKDVKGLIKALDYQENAHVREGVAQFIRQDAAEALGEMGGLQAVDSLIAATLDNNPLVRRKAILALGKIGDSRAVGPLVAVLEDKFASISECAAVLLRNFLKEGSLSEPLKKRILSVNHIIIKEIENVKLKKRIMLENSRNCWHDRLIPKNVKRFCKACQKRIYETRGTSMLGSCMWCKDCTEKMFLRWEERGPDLLRFHRD